MLAPATDALTGQAVCVYNDWVLNFLFMTRRTRWNARLVRFGKVD